MSTDILEKHIASGLKSKPSKKPTELAACLSACQWTIWHHIPDDEALQNHCLENLQSYKHVSTMNVYIIRSITFTTLKYLHGTVYICISSYPNFITTIKIK